MKLLLAGFLAFLALPGAAPAFAQVDSREGIALQNQILELRHELDLLRQSSGRGGSVLVPPAAPPAYVQPGQASAPLTTSLLDRVNRMEEDMRALRGQLDETNNALRQQNADLSKQIADLKFRLGINDNTAGTAPPPGSPPVSLSPQPGSLGGTPVPPIPPPTVRRTADQALQEGNAALARRDYATAEALAREVLTVPRGPRSTDAQFLLAQAMAGKRDYTGAAVAYDDAYQRARTGTHAQDSLLGMAVALNALGNGRAACATLDKLKAEFPSTRPDLRESVAGVRQRAGCH